MTVPNAVMAGIGLTLAIMVGLTQTARAEQTGVKTAEEPAEKSSMVDFAKHLVRIEAPVGWSIVDSGTRKDHAWCVLQKDGAKAPRPTITVLCGRDFVTQAPGGDKILAGGPAAAMLHATGRALAWARAQPESPFPRVTGQATSTVPRYGKTQYFAQSLAFQDGEFKGCSAYAVMAGKRVGGPLVAACFDQTDQMKSTQLLLESILTATYVRQSPARKR